ncbi:MAG: beta-ketoacyl-[acyl-carrier-protein] synthase family protein [Deltaproteobacteria bacterium]|nr:beta-ketoacyl-[acyl-carrier-protein] synthase family protein [Deltaproteobacteria bacterium]
MQRVVITGMGLVSCLGPDLAAVTSSLREGRSGIVRSEARAALGFSSNLTGALPHFDARNALSRKERRAMGEPALYAANAALDALADAHLERDRVATPRAGVIIGNDSVCADAWRAADQTLRDGTTRNLGSAAVVRCMNSSPSINLSVMLRTRGACWSLSAACASGAHAIGQAWSLVATGQQDVVICGGTQELDWTGMAGFDALGAFTSWEGEPAKAARPFSHDRDGLVPSGGAAILVLESLEHARRRDARVRAEVLSYAFSSDGFHVTAPAGDGAVQAIHSALQAAALGPGEIEYVNAHAPGTVVGDRIEAEAILEVFGERGPPVSSTKSMSGHECWMSGASEVAYSLLMAEGGFIAPNCNYAGPEPGLEALDVVTTPREVRPRTILSNSFGFGGTNACLVLRAGALE